MPLSNYHTHTTYCDGRNTAEEMIISAIERGFSEIGFSSHSPIMGEDWTMSKEDIPLYKKKLLSLREKYKEKIKVYIGIEQDVLSSNPTDGFDYVIGSVHSVNAGGKEYSVDCSLFETKRAIDEGFGGDPYALAESYFDRVATLYERTGCDIVAHFDLITKFIEKEAYLSEEHPRYRNAREKALEKLFSAPVVFEVNTGAIARGYRTSPYPTFEVIKRIAEAGKPLVINSDAHRADMIDFGIIDTKKTLSSLGIKCISSMEEIKQMRLK